MRLSASSLAATAIFAACLNEANEWPRSHRDTEKERWRESKNVMSLRFLSLSISVSVSLWRTFFPQYFRSGLDNSLVSVEDLRLNKSEISQASVSSSNEQV
jgi:hypothetical protein